jgi:hypothetical protein
MHKGISWGLLYKHNAGSDLFLKEIGSGGRKRHV